MRKIREVLQLRHEQGLSHQTVAGACGVGVGTVNRYLRWAAECGLGWPLPGDLDDAALEARLFPRAAPVRDRVRPDCAHIHRELKRGGVTLQLLWEEYAGVHPRRLPLHPVLRDLPAVGAAAAAIDAGTFCISSMPSTSGSTKSSRTSCSFSVWMMRAKCSGAPVTSGA